MSEAGNMPLPVEELQRVIGAHVLEAVALRHELAVVTHERDLLRQAADRRPVPEPVEPINVDLTRLVVADPVSTDEAEATP